MRELTLAERKKMSLEILCDIDRICRQHEIKYYLAYGSLIGAVRHHGFIPWDDDIDIWMPIKDVERFHKIIKKETKYWILGWWDTDKNPNYFSKINYPGTKMIDSHTGTPMEYPRGVAVDVFPLTFFNSIKKRKIAFVERMISMRKWYELNKKEPLNGWKTKVKRSIVYMDRILHKDDLYWLSLSYKIKLFGGGTLLGCWDSPYGMKDLHSPEDFQKAIDLDFEGKKFLAPVGYNTILHRIYGDYMQLPPKEKRISNHSVKAMLL